MGTFKFMSFDSHLPQHSFFEEFESIDVACVCLRIAARFAPRRLWRLYVVTCKRLVLLAEVKDGVFSQWSF